jgi:hypothetical protein
MVGVELGLCWSGLFFALGPYFSSNGLSRGFAGVALMCRCAMERPAKHTGPLMCRCAMELHSSPGGPLMCRCAVELHSSPGGNLPLPLKPPYNISSCLAKSHLILLSSYYSILLSFYKDDSFSFQNLTIQQRPS